MLFSIEFSRAVEIVHTTGYLSKYKSYFCEKKNKLFIVYPFKSSLPCIKNLLKYLFETTLKMSGNRC